MQLDAEIEVSRPVSVVFDYWANLENGPEWAGPVVEPTKLTDGPVGVGTRYHAVDRFPGRDLEFEVEVVAFEPNRLMTAKVGEPMNGGWEARFSESDGKTTVHLLADVSPPGPLKFLAPMMGGWMKRAIVKDLRSFKARLEQRSP